MEIIALIVTVIVLAVGIGLVCALPVMWCWNGFMPAVFGLPAITFWQAFALTTLCSILFSNGSGSSKD